LAQRGRNLQSRLRTAGVAFREGPSVRKRDYGQRVKGADAVVEQRLPTPSGARTGSPAGSSDTATSAAQTRLHGEVLCAVYAPRAFILLSRASAELVPPAQADPIRYESTVHLSRSERRRGRTGQAAHCCVTECCTYQLSGTLRPSRSCHCLSLGPRPWVFQRRRSILGARSCLRTNAHAPQEDTAGS
jgi:hypothetical protein